jgi:oligopeptide transport system substrate-binding protein
MLVNFKNNSWQLIDSVSTNEIKNLQADPQYKDEFKIAGQIGTYYVCWNVNKNILPADSELKGVEAEKAMQEIRNAVSLLLDRNYIVESVAMGGQLPASSFVAMGMTDADGTEFYKNANSKTDSFDGYYDVSREAYEANVKQALETLKKYYEIKEG